MRGYETRILLPQVAEPCRFGHIPRSVLYHQLLPADQELHSRHRSYLSCTTRGSKSGGAVAGKGENAL